MAYQGYLISSKGKSNALSSSEINNTMTNKCSGSNWANCFNDYSNLLVRNYNSTFSTTSMHCNVHAFNAQKTDSMFLQFYRNNHDLVYGANSPGNNHKLSHANLISNGLSNPHSDNSGYIHTYNFADEVMTIDNLYMFNNSNNLFYAKMGRIEVSLFWCDVFTYIGSPLISSNVIIDSNFVLKSEVTRKLVCNLNSYIRTYQSNHWCRQSSRYFCRHLSSILQKPQNSVVTIEHFGEAKRISQICYKINKKKQCFSTTCKHNQLTSSGLASD